ncbi:hypothetical protein JGU66_28440 [Myxococcaceae bacterium JPH2]|nr:hypothetical protein [Myxococcaceae bacterium JPH2]
MPASFARPWCLVVLLSPLLACGMGAKAQRPTPAPRPAATREFEKEMVAAHNQARARARPTPKPALPALTWSEDAARKAESWAKECRFEHNPNRGEFGENLAAATPNTWTTPQVVKSWADESADFDLARNTCTRGKVCGHYTQVVWRNTKAVGCATRLCTKNSPFGKDAPTWQLWVCDYAPPGNWVGERPY